MHRLKGDVLFFPSRDDAFRYTLDNGQRLPLGRLAQDARKTIRDMVKK
jgi:hypothetical protein